MADKNLVSICSFGFGFGAGALLGLIASADPAGQDVLYIMKRSGVAYGVVGGTALVQSVAGREKGQSLMRYIGNIVAAEAGFEIGSRIFNLGRF